MEIKQGPMLCLLFGLFALISCKIYENRKHDKREETARAWQHLELRQRLYTFRQDTLSRLWYFWTDSAFRFHADSGLFAQSGSVLWQETGGSSSKEMQDVDIKNDQGKQKDNKQERSSNKMLSATYFWLVGFALVLLLLWRWTRSRLLV